MRNSIFLSLLALLTACSDNSSAVGTSSNANAQYVLAFSWQPAFCETRPRKRECKTQTVDRFDASHFTLHGLWPQPGSNIYCGVSDDEMARDKKGRWRDLDAPRISEAIWQELRKVMPGTMSSLHKHEWVKHGTCYSDDIDKYYADSLKLMDWLNGSSLRQRFESSIGSSLTGREIRAAFDADFGNGAGERLRISCKRDQDSDRNMIIELTLGLAGDIGSANNLTDLVMAAPSTDPGCPQGIVDPVGLQ